MPDEPSTDLVTHEYHAPAILTDTEIDSLWRVGKALAASRMFKDAQQAEQAFAKIILGRDLGLSPAQAMTGIHIVQGKPQVAATMLAAFVRSRPEYDFKVTEHTDQVCSIDFYRNGEKIGTSSFTWDDATRAKLNGKDVWKQHPRNMLYARAMSNGVKWYAPDATNGLPVYVEGEIVDAPHLVNGGTGPTPEGDADPFAPADPPDAEVIPGQTEITDLIDGEAPPPDAGVAWDPEKDA